jgi:uncharacterized membrane protein
MPNISPLITSRADNRPLYPGVVFYASAFPTITQFGAAQSYPAGTTVTINSGTLSEPVFFNVNEEGEYMYTIALTNAGINWNAGTNSTVAISLHNEGGSPTYPVVLQPSDAVPQIKSATGIDYLVPSGNPYTFDLTINPVGQAVNLTGAGAVQIEIYVYKAGIRNYN